MNNFTGILTVFMYNEVRIDVHIIAIVLTLVGRKSFDFNGDKINNVYVGWKHLEIDKYNCRYLYNICSLKDPLNLYANFIL